MPVPDTPASTDELGFDRFAVPLARTIAATDRSTTPWTIGVYGEWGSGKTTFLRLVENALEPSGVRPIWFNAWKYAREDNLWAALIEKIVRDARRSVPWYRVPDVRLRIRLRSIDFGAGFWELFRKLLAIGFKVATLTLLILMAISLVPVAGNPVTGWLAGSPLFAAPWVRVLAGVVAALGTKPEALLKLFDVKLGADLAAFRRRRAHRSQTALLDDFTAEFQGVLKVVYRRKPLVVFIDDLDRCLPEQTLQIIETIKLFLDEPGCVFLLAVDREVIEQAIRVKYKDLPAVDELGERFFEKIVQLPYSLPAPAESRVESYIRSISPDSEVSRCLEILRGTPPYNPRRIKRNVQAFTMLKELSAELEPVSSVLAKLVVIQAQFRQVYRAAVNDHGLLARLEQACRSPDEDVDVVLKAQVERFTELYPGLKALLCLGEDDVDTFSSVCIDAYLSIVDTVAVTEEASSEPPRAPESRTVVVTCLGEDLAWGRRIARVLHAAGRHAVVADLEHKLDLLDEYVIGVWTRASSGSLDAERLWALAVAKGLPFLAVRVDNALATDFLRDQESLDLSGTDEEEFDRALLSHFGYPLVTWARDAPHPLRPSSIHNLPALPADFFRRNTLPARALREGITVLVGLPGTGKTTLAIQHGKDRLVDCSIVWLIRAATRHEDLSELARRLSVPPDGLAERLTSAGRVLLIYDGFDDPRVVDELPQVGWIVVTTHNRSWGEYGSMTEVGPLSREQSVRFLRVPDAESLAEELGDLPLALTCAKRQLRATGQSVEAYLRRFREDGVGFVKHDGLSLSDALDQVIRQVSDHACTTLITMCCFGRLPIPRELVTTVEVRAGDLAELVQLSLVTEVPGGFDVNQAVRRCAVELLADWQRLERVESQVNALIARAAPPEAADLVERARSWQAARTWTDAQFLDPNSL